MPLIVVINIPGKGKKPAVKHVKRSEVVERAGKSGSKNPQKASLATVPRLSIYKPAGFFYEYREYLWLTLNQIIYIANELSPCSQDIWEEHEKEHITANELAMQKMEREIRDHTGLQKIFQRRLLIPKNQHDKVMGTVVSDIGDIFIRLISEENANLDSPAIYAAIRKRIFHECSGPFYHEVERGDSLSKIARHYYGNARLWEAIYKNKENRSKIGANSDLIHPGLNLLIPKKPGGI